MKTNTLRRTRGFTLVEILVVITIISVLAGLGFAGVQSATRKAKQVNATAACVNLVTSVNNFFDEYNYLPASGSNDVKVDTNSGDIMVILIGKEGGNTVKNTKKIRFFSGKDAKGKKDGLVASGSNAQLFDPEGRGYQLLIDTNYDQELKAPYGNATSLGGLRALAWSLGKDNQISSSEAKNAGKNKDNSYSN